MIYLKLRKVLALGMMGVLIAFSSMGATPASITVAWDPSLESDVAGYRVHYGTASGNYDTTVEAGESVMAFVNGLVEGNTYYFVVTAYNNSGVESSPSEEITHAIVAPPSFEITSLPFSQVVARGSSLTLSVSASGPESLSYQWHKDDAAIPGAVESAYTITNIGATGIGAYSVTVRDSNASLITPAAIVSTVQMQKPKEIVIDGVPGANYAIAYTENLLGNVWSQLTNIALTSSSVQWVDSSATNSNHRFYRITPLE